MTNIDHVKMKVIFFPKVTWQIGYSTVYHFLVLV